MAVRECCSREPVVANVALQCGGTVSAMHAHRGILLESENLFLVFADFASVAVHAPQEFVAVLPSPL